MSMLELNKNEIASIRGGVLEPLETTHEMRAEVVEGFIACIQHWSCIKRWLNASKTEICVALDKFFNNSTIIVI